VAEIVVRYKAGGIHLPELGLWLDSHARQGSEWVFISHAHADHIRAHQQSMATEPTFFFMHQRLKCQGREKVMACEMAEDFKHGAAPYRLTCVSAGHILGSAMAHVESRGSSLLYTGDFKLEPGFTGEVCKPRAADILIMETTFGRPHYAFPPRAVIREQALNFCRETLAEGKTPVLLAYSLGKAQELIRALEGLEHPIMLHDQVFETTRVYTRFGQPFPPFTQWDHATCRKSVVICPPHGFSGKLRQAVQPCRTAMFTGWAIDSNCRYRCATDAAFPLSDHSDFKSLLDLVKQVSPRKIYTVHGFAADFAATLRELGHDARALSEPDQLTLPMGILTRGLGATARKE
jgi:Cft2 family RNA processing exonuclease